MQYGIAIPLFCAAFVHLTTLAYGANDRVVRDPLEIKKLLQSVPTVAGDLETQLQMTGMKVDSITLHTLTRADVAEDPQRYAFGDVEWWVVTSGEPRIPGCKVLGSPRILKRGRYYIAQDRTGVWLLTGECDYPNQKYKTRAR